MRSTCCSHLARHTKGTALLVCFLCDDFKASHKFSRIICGQNGLFLNIFTYLCQYAFQKTFRVMTTSTPHRYTKKRLMKAVGAHTPCSCGYMQDGGLYFYIKDYQGNVRVVLNQRMLDCEGDEVQDIKKAIKVEWYIRQNVAPYEERKIQTCP